MSDNRVTETLVSWCTFPEEVRPLVESVALKDPSLKNHLANNPGLTVASWWKIYKPSLKSSLALALVGRTLTREQRLHVFQSDKRSTVVEAVVENNVLDTEEQRLLITSPGFSNGVASKLLAAPWCDVAVRRDVAVAAGGQVQLDWLANSTQDECSDEEARRLLSTYSEWGPALKDDSPRGKRSQNQALLALLNRRPSLMDTATQEGQNKDVVMVAAGCRHLTEEADQLRILGFTPGGDVSWETLARLKFRLMALVNNPATTPLVVDEVIRAASSVRQYEAGELASSATSRKARYPQALSVPYEEIDDAESLRWILNRSLPSDFKPQGRPFDVLALAHNPSMDPSSARRVARACNEVSTISYAEYLAAMERLQENYPDLDVEVERSEESFTTSDYVSCAADLWSAPSYSVLDLDRISCWSLTDRSVADRCTSALSEVLGSSQSAWETFFGLVPEYQGNVGELAAVCQAL